MSHHNRIEILDIRHHAFHGCLEEEALTGTDFATDVIITGDISGACKNDELSLTYDYVTVHQVVTDIMGQRAKLIEHVAYRILHALKGTYPNAAEIIVRVTKFRPPINGGFMGKATVQVSSREL